MESQPKAVFEIDSLSYSQQVHLYSNNCVSFHRSQWISASRIELDTFGSSWLLAFAHISKGQLSCHRLGESIPRDGWQGFFLPPYSLVEWHLNKGHLKWYGFMSESELPPELPKQAMAFSLNSKDQPQNHEEALKLLVSTSQLNNTVIIEKEENDSNIAHEVKAFIDQHFYENLPIQDIASQLQCHRVAMGREFKRCYGLSPVDYRNRLRIFHSTKLLRQGLDVTTACYQSGFGHISRFQENFKKIMKVSPIEFCFEKKSPSHPLKNQGGICKWKEFSLPEEPDL